MLCKKSKRRFTEQKSEILGLVRTVPPIPIVGAATKLEPRIDAIVPVLVLTAVDVVLGAATVVVKRVLWIVPVVTVVSRVVSVVSRSPQLQ